MDSAAAKPSIAFVKSVSFAEGFLAVASSKVEKILPRANATLIKGSSAKAAASSLMSMCQVFLTFPLMQV